MGVDEKRERVVKRDNGNGRYRGRMARESSICRRMKFYRGSHRVPEIYYVAGPLWIFDTRTARQDETASRRDAWTEYQAERSSMCHRRIKPGLETHS